jgi:hypothetical protein
MTSTAQASKYGQLRCEVSRNYSSDQFEVTLNVDSKFTTSRDFYELKNVKLDLRLDVLNDSEIFYKFKGIAFGTTRHNPFYAPRVYKDHLQFSPNFIAPQYDIETYEGHLQGDLKLIIPEKVFQSPLYNRIFKAYAILTSIDDHWGDTVELECRVLRD